MMRTCFVWANDHSDSKLAFDLVEIWLKSEFTTEERHIRRIGKIDNQ